MDMFSLSKQMKIASAHPANLLRASILSLLLVDVVVAVSLR